jgi:hypothetical protein
MWTSFSDEMTTKYLKGRAKHFSEPVKTVGTLSGADIE